MSYFEADISLKDQVPVRDRHIDICVWHKCQITSVHIYTNSVNWV